MKGIKSMNLWTSVVTIITMTFITGQGVDFDNLKLIELLNTQEGIALAVNAVLLLVTPVLKTINRIKQNGFDWSVLKSKNFAAHLTSLVGIIAGMWAGQEQAGFVSALAVQVFNFIIHRVPALKS